MAPHSSTLAWKIPWMEEPGRLQSMGSLRVGHNWVTSLSLSCIGEGNGNPLQCSCLENLRDGRAWWAAVYGVAQSRTRLKQLSSSSSGSIHGVILSAGSYILTFFPYVYAYYIFSYPISIARTSNTTLNNQARVGTIVLFLIFEEKLSAFAFEYYVTCGFAYCPI